MSGDNRLRGITCPDMTRVVREALRGGWEWGGISGSTHALIRWPKTGDVLRFGTTPSVASWKSLARDIKKISGVEVWRKGNRRRSRKSPNSVDAQLEAARAKHHAEYLDRLDRRATDKERERAWIEQDEQLAELREACEYAAATAREHPQDRRARAHFERLRQQLHEALEGKAS